MMSHYRGDEKCAVLGKAKVYQNMTILETSNYANTLSLAAKIVSRLKTSRF
jgi:hypothetical protein